MSSPHEEWLRSKYDSDPKFKAVADDARLFGELLEHPAWQRLMSRLDKERVEYMQDIAQRLLDGFEVTQREIDFMAGFYKGAMYVLKHPEQAEKSFEKAARLAWVFEEHEQEVQDVPSSPYA